MANKLKFTTFILRKTMSSENKGSTSMLVKLKVKNTTTIKALMTKVLWVQLVVLACC